MPFTHLPIPWPNLLLRFDDTSFYICVAPDTLPQIRREDLSSPPLFCEIILLLLAIALHFPLACRNPLSWTLRPVRLSGFSVTGIFLCNSS